LLRELTQARLQLKPFRAPSSFAIANRLLLCVEFQLASHQTSRLLLDLCVLSFEPLVELVALLFQLLLPSVEFASQFAKMLLFPGQLIVRNTKLIDKLRT